MADGWYDSAAEGDRLVVEADAADRPRPSVVAALSHRPTVVMIVVSPAQPTLCSKRAFDAQRHRHEVDRTARAAASGALLVVNVIAAAAAAATTLQATSQLGVPVCRAAGRS